MKLLREPLLHFLVIGAVLFGVFQLGRPVTRRLRDEIVVSAGQIASLEAIFSQTWQRPPTADGSWTRWSANYIRDEVLYREGVAMGLDRDDAVVRRRMRQKMEFVADLTADVEPTDAELKAFVAEHPERFRGEPRFSFSHVYFRQARKRPNAAELERLLPGPECRDRGCLDGRRVRSWRASISATCRDPMSRRFRRRFRGVDRQGGAPAPGKVR